MSLSLSDVVTLAKAGFTAPQIAAFVNSERATTPVVQTVQPSPTASPAVTPGAQPGFNAIPMAPAVGTPAVGVSSFSSAGAVQAATAPTAPAPDENPILATLAQLNTRLDALATPQAGSLSGTPGAPVTSIEDIISGPIARVDPPVTPEIK